MLVLLGGVAVAVADAVAVAVAIAAAVLLLFRYLSNGGGSLSLYLYEALYKALYIKDFGFISRDHTPSRKGLNRN